MTHYVSVGEPAELRDSLAVAVTRAVTVIDVGINVDPDSPKSRTVDTGSTDVLPMSAGKVAI